jgi:hypothetical protein
MSSDYKIRKIAFSFLLSGLLVSCVNSSYHSREQYLLGLPKNSAVNNAAISTCRLNIAPVTATPPYDSLDFLYRVTNNRYLVDYYHGFLVMPTEQLDNILKYYFKSDSCKLASNTISSYNLQVELLELDADYRKPQQPQGIITLRFYLTRIVNGKSIVLLDQIERSCLALLRKDNSSLLQAWNSGLNKILEQMKIKLIQILAT